MADQNRGDRANVQHPTGVSGTSPTTSGPAGGTSINPSGPTTGTEGYGNARDEGGIAANNPSSTVPGKEGGGNLRTFRCADAGHKDCSWEAQGRSEEELMPQIERHGREKHGIKDFDENKRKELSNYIRERGAA
jgi:predicted small metal-binding protein